MMKRIGLLGGMTWKSTIEYYRILNEEVNRRLGGIHSADCIMLSVDFGEIEKLMIAEKWDRITDILVSHAKSLENNGAEMLVICTNTMHLMAEEIRNSISIPLIHIVDAAAKQIVNGGMKKVGLLGTRFTMEKKFYKSRLYNKYNIETIIPDAQGIALVNDVIFKELSVGYILDQSREKYKTVIDDLVSRGAEAVILGCTEIPLLISEKDSPVPVLDTTLLHALEAVEYSLS